MRRQSRCCVMPLLHVRAAEKNTRRAPGGRCVGSIEDSTIARCSSLPASLAGPRSGDMPSCLVAALDSFAVDHFFQYPVVVNDLHPH